MIVFHERNPPKEERHFDCIIAHESLSSNSDTIAKDSLIFALFYLFTLLFIFHYLGK